MGLDALWGMQWGGEQASWLEEAQGVQWEIG